MNKTKAIAIMTIFVLMLAGLAVAMFVLPDQALSYAERRKLAQAPQLSAEAVFSGQYMTDLEEYLLDQFPLRDSWRTVKAALRFYVFAQRDNNGVYLVDGSVFKMEYPLKENQVLYGANKINQTLQNHLQGMNVYYAVIPDKNYFAAAQNGYPAMDYDRLFALMRQNVDSQIEQITLTDVLDLSDYYRTDSHWRQECVYAVAERIAGAMGVQIDPFSAYEAHALSPFYGVYCGQSALPVAPDTLVYMTSETTESAVVTGAEFSGTKPVYDTERFSGMDGYDVFLSGAQAVLTIENPNATTERELIIFRDSFASSLTPYLISGYSRITLVDLRYISSQLLDQYVQFPENADVLFLYSTSLLNSAMLLK